MAEGPRGEVPLGGRDEVESQCKGREYQARSGLGNLFVQTTARSGNLALKSLLS
jgi:hypothetical protein